jgi:hypothetical protein
MAESGERGLPLLVACRTAGLTTRDVWFRYLALGGNADETSVEAQIHGVLDLAPGEYNVLAHALNEALDDAAEKLTAARVAYRESVRGEDARGRGR